MVRLVKPAKALKSLALMALILASAAACEGAPRKAPGEPSGQLQGSVKAPESESSAELIAKCKAHLTERLERPSEADIGQIDQYCEQRFGLVVRPAEPSGPP